MGLWKWYCNTLVKLNFGIDINKLQKEAKKRRRQRKANSPSVTSSPITGKKYTGSNKGNFSSTTSNTPSIPKAAFTYNAPSYEQVSKYKTPDYAKTALKGYETPTLKGHYNKEDISKQDVNIMVLSQAVKGLTETIEEAEKTNPNLIAQNKELLDSYNNVVEYALKQGFSMDQTAVDDRLAKYGYQDSSSKMGAMVALANKRVGSYLNAKKSQAEYANKLKDDYTANLRQDMSAIGQNIAPLTQARQSMINTVAGGDKLEADNITNLNNISISQEQNRNVLAQSDAQYANSAYQNAILNRNKILQKDAENRATVSSENYRSNLLRNELFAKVDREMYNRIQGMNDNKQAVYMATKNKNYNKPRSDASEIALSFGNKFAKEGASKISSSMGEKFDTWMKGK